ncbi:serine/threonine-protein kinase [Streptomyces sp. LHD-70]|uniref:serine/threonine-protein kinase n=1 Tax=Streptomyces sp. LHD-70 TaxID=3072140 RepID=UPI00280E9614|nr:serine/threonine-protein kinase [Streptomyces sp. LHD-70]MDQ8700878.1 serine/threonine-protein kinase [Streptomyces sp. LHD-70]
MAGHAAGVPGGAASAHHGDGDGDGRIGPYRLLDVLGTGGMGRVYLARSEGGRTVAVKLIKAELAAEPEFRERFRLEVEAARRVGDRWTAPVLDADTEADTPWVATGYIAGPSLEHVVSPRGHGPLPEHSVRTLAYGLSSALLDIHGAGLVHRDLKPSNVLVTIDGPRVIDFGIARALDYVPETTLTSAGMVVGSPSFMSPEQIRGEQLTPASDVFCMGALLAYAVTGCAPFGGGGAGGVHAVMFKIAQEEPDLTGIQEPLRSLIAGCLAKDPAARTRSEDVIDQVQPVATGTSAPPWLPAQLIAELGRRAVRLLDTDTPPRATATPISAPMHAPTPTPTSTSAPTPIPAPTPSSDPGPGLTLAHAPTPAHVEPGTVQLPKAPQQPEWAEQSGPAPQLKQAEQPPKRTARKLVLALAGAAVVAGAVVAASPAGWPPLGGGEPSGGPGKGAASDVPRGFVGTWAGEVERDGRPSGQFRRFEISEGQYGEVVANSISLGRNYECKSDGKLAGRASGGSSLRLDTKVVRSVPEGSCSALGAHTLVVEGKDALRWEAAGRTAVLHRITGPERLPDELLGTWQRQLANGGTQRMTVTQEAVGSSAARLVSEGGGEHCEAGMDLVSTGGRDADEAVRLAPPAVDRAASSGACVTGDSSILREENGRLVREFTDGAVLTYTRV